MATFYEERSEIPLDKRGRKRIKRLTFSDLREGGSPDE